MKDRSPLFNRIIRRAQDDVASQRLSRSKVTLYDERHSHEFVLPVADGENAAAFNLFMKAVCQVLGARYSVTVSVVSFALGEGGPEPLASSEQKKPALMVTLTHRDGRMEVYLAEMRRQEAGSLSFHELKGLDPDDLAGVIANPFTVPKEGLPDWLLVQAREVLCIPDHSDGPLPPGLIN